jgi:signal transduction histidine kinase
MRYSLSRQLLLPLVAVSLASLLATGVLAAWMASAATRERIERQLGGVVRVLADPRFPLTTPVLEQMRDLSASEFAVTDEQGKLLATSGPKLAEDSRPRELPRDGSQVELGPRLEIDGRGYYHASLRLATDRAVRRDAVLHVLYPTDEYDAAWRGAFLPPLVVGIVTIVGIATTVSLVAARVARVTRDLAGEVARLAEGDFSSVALPHRNDELRDLAVAVDQTARQLQQYEQHVRTTEQLRTAHLLGASLAHEMRNAATGCRMAIDLHGRQCQVPHDDSLDVARQQLTLMESRLRRFLRVAAPERPAQQTQIDLREVIDQATALTQPAAEHAGIALDWHRPAKAMPACVDRDGLLQAVLNLVLNAIDAVSQRPEAHIAVELQVADEGWQLMVADNGPGPSAAIAERMFEPFATDKPEGAGLGLAGTRQFAEDHGGTIAWHRENDRTCFVLTAPLAKGN